MGGAGPDQADLRLETDVVFCVTELVGVGRTCIPVVRQALAALLCTAAAAWPAAPALLVVRRLHMSERGAEPAGQAGHGLPVQAESGKGRCCSAPVPHHLGAAMSCARSQNTLY